MKSFRCAAAYPCTLLPRTLLFLPGIGPVRETRLWKRGVLNWGDYRELGHVKGIRPRLKARHDELLLLAERALGRDPAFFAHVLPTTEHWRAYGHFHEDAAYLDIETTGDRENLVTVVGVRRGGESRAFVRGIDYTPEAVSEFLRGASMLVTFNGASFDLPVLARSGVALPAAPHVDLRPVLARAGYEGGLKRIEQALGLAREGEVAGLSGWDAVKLWRRWERDRDQAALDTLVAYNVADFENLEPLARHACHLLETQLLDATGHQTRLTAAAPQEARPAGP